MGTYMCVCVCQLQAVTGLGLDLWGSFSQRATRGKRTSRSSPILEA
jgi:hypothetical protein